MESPLNAHIYLVCFVKIYSEDVADKFICKSCFTLHLKRLICNLGAIFLHFEMLDLGAHFVTSK